MSSWGMRSIIRNHYLCLTAETQSLGLKSVEATRLLSGLNRRKRRCYVVTTFHLFCWTYLVSFGQNFWRQRKLSPLFDVRNFDVVWNYRIRCCSLELLYNIRCLKSVGNFFNKLLRLQVHEKQKHQKSVHRKTRKQNHVMWVNAMWMSSVNFDIGRWRFSVAAV